MGVVKGGTSRKFAPILQVGAQLDLTWRARLQDHLGSFKVELVRARIVNAMSDRVLTAGLMAVSTMLSGVLPERQAYDEFYRTTEDLLDLLNQPDIWPLAYLHWELELLTVLGYGLDLSKCAVSEILTTCDMSPLGLVVPLARKQQQSGRQNYYIFHLLF